MFYATTTKKCLPKENVCVSVCLSVTSHSYLGTYVLTPYVCSDTLPRHWNQLRWSWRGGARAAAVVMRTERTESIPCRSAGSTNPPIHQVSKNTPQMHAVHDDMKSRPPGKKLSFFFSRWAFLWRILRKKKKKLLKSFSTDKFQPNRQIFWIGISPIPPLVMEIRSEYSKNAANAFTDLQELFLELSDQRRVDVLYRHRHESARTELCPSVTSQRQKTLACLFWHVVVC